MAKKYKGITLSKHKMVVFPDTNKFEKLKGAIDKAGENDVSFNKHMVNSSL